ncbi:cell division ATP-binding protein FtsE [Nesterenkonia flava]|uniref:Cell division ATP-binding protein FtsE n=1 Tax=Nesterenkonia flava TaxID=469799 RepID=A0ABU1FTI0_9MICC|nr:cell division ATP-binding protein FtsE [Nesterenkonia flava]MDR5711647.1 cell division ATP-binding protein FtsE [Nesterenkonia flava]
MIRFEHVTRSYAPGGRPALDDVSIEFGRGDFVFLIGASGSGKSTLLRMILREGLPQRGKITVAGQNLGLMLERRVPEYRRSIGMVFQDFRLLPDKTVFDNVAFAMRVIGASRGQIRKRVTQVLKRVGLDHLAKRYPHEISGGEQQRAAIARAIVNNPAILLADEPTGNLDPRASAEVMKILRWINAAGTTVIMATHDRAIVDRMGKRVVQLHKGKLVRDERHGLYDPPEGSEAWQILVKEEAESGLRAEDPAPLRTQAVPLVAPAEDEAEDSPASANSAASPEPARRSASEEATEQAHEQAQDATPAEPSASQEDAQHERAAEPGAETEEVSTATKTESVRIVWPEEQKAARYDDAAESLISAAPMDSDHMPVFDNGSEDEPQEVDEHRDSPRSEPEAPASEAPAPERTESVTAEPEAEEVSPVDTETEPKASESPAAAAAPEPATPGPAALAPTAPEPAEPESAAIKPAAPEPLASKRRREPDQDRLAWLTSAFEEQSASSTRTASSETAESSTAVPKPKSSASEATYADSRRTEEQLEASKRGIFRRRRGKR